MPRLRLRQAAALAFAVAFAWHAQAATVTIVVQNVRSDRGHVLVAICSRADFLHPHCGWKGNAPSHMGETIVVVRGVPPGLYAAQAFQDANDNGRLDRNLLGLPEEGMGFSNDARMYFGPPRFEAASFTVPPQGVTIRFRLKYY